MTPMHDCPKCRCEPPLPTLTCSKCGIEEDETYDLDWPGLDDYEVIVRAGEEGFSDVIMHLCADCSVPMRDALMDLGFKNHHHGGTSYLQDEDCPGDLGGDCPTPHHYSRFYVGNYEWTKAEDD